MADVPTEIGVAPLLQRLVTMETFVVTMETQLVTMDVVAVTMDAQVVLVTQVPVPVEVPWAPPLQVAVTMETQLVTMEVDHVSIEARLVMGKQGLVTCGMSCALLSGDVVSMELWLGAVHLRPVA